MKTVKELLSFTIWKNFWPTLDSTDGEMGIKFHLKLEVLFIFPSIFTPG